MTHMTQGLLAGRAIAVPVINIADCQEIRCWQVADVGTPAISEDARAQIREVMPM
jgi:hypothetical protein